MDFRSYLFNKNVHFQDPKFAHFLGEHAAPLYCLPVCTPSKSYVTPLLYYPNNDNHPKQGKQGSVLATWISSIVTPFNVYSYQCVKLSLPFSSTQWLYTVEHHSYQHQSGKQTKWMDFCFHLRQQNFDALRKIRDTKARIKGKYKKRAKKTHHQWPLFGHFSRQYSETLWSSWTKHVTISIFVSNE